MCHVQMGSCLPNRKTLYWHSLGRALLCICKEISLLTILLSELHNVLNYEEKHQFQVPDRDIDYL